MPKPTEPKLSSTEIAFVRGLIAELSQDAAEYQAKKNGRAGDTIFIQPPPLMYSFFIPE